MDDYNLYDPSVDETSDQNKMKKKQKKHLTVLVIPTLISHILQFRFVLYDTIILFDSHVNYEIKPFAKQSSYFYSFKSNGTNTEREDFQLVFGAAENPVALAAGKLRVYTQLWFFLSPNVLGVKYMCVWVYTICV